MAELSVSFTIKYAESVYACVGVYFEGERLNHKQKSLDNESKYQS